MAILLIALPRYVVHTQRILRARGLSGIVLAWFTLFIKASQNGNQSRPIAFAAGVTSRYGRSCNIVDAVHKSGDHPARLPSLYQRYRYDRMVPVNQTDMQPRNGMCEKLEVRSHIDMRTDASHIM